MSSFNSSSDRFRTSIVSYLTRLSRDRHMFHVYSYVLICSLLMFSHVQFSTRVIFGFAILLSNHVFCQPCRHFCVDIFSVISMLFFTRTSIFAWVNTTILLLCINRKLKCCNPAAVLFSPHRRFRRYDIEALAHTAAQIASSQLYLFGDSLPRTLSFTPSAGTTHCC